MAMKNLLQETTYEKNLQVMALLQIQILVLVRGLLQAPPSRQMVHVMAPVFLLFSASRVPSLQVRIPFMPC